MRRCVALLLLVCLIGAGLGMAVSPAHAQVGPLQFFEPVRGLLIDTRPVEEWTFAGHADQVVSLIVVARSGNLDPVLQLIGPDNVLVARNDDLDSLVFDAGLEAFVLPVDGTYTVRVTRYEGAEGTTSGEYELTLTPGFAQLARQDTFSEAGVDHSWVTPEGQPVLLDQGRLRLRASGSSATALALPPGDAVYDDLYLQVEARLLGTMSYAEGGVLLRRQEEGSAYQFRFNTDGQWTVLLQDESGQFTLRSWSAHPALAGTQWTLGVLARGNTLSFFANDALLGTITDNRLLTAGAVGLVAGTRSGQTDNATLLYDNLLITTRLGTTYRGLPLALTTWNEDDPGLIVAELAGSGLLQPAEWHDLFLLEKSMVSEQNDAVFELIGSAQAVYDNFILGARVGAVTAGTSNACGLVYRWEDEANLHLVFIDTAGGFGVVQSQAGELTTNAYDTSTMLNGEPGKLLLVARDNQVALYINGALVTQEVVTPGTGRVGVALLNYETARTDCFWSNIWVWPLEAE